MNSLDALAKTGLYRPEFEHDNCGFGLIAQIDGESSHQLVKSAVRALARMTHRGAIAADGKSGDGCGLLLKKPELFLREKARECGFEPGRYFATGMIFLSRDSSRAEKAKRRLVEMIEARQLQVDGWRTVPVNVDACGREATKSMPNIEQLFVTAPRHMDTAEFNRKLFVARRKAEIELRAEDPDFFVCSLSADVILYLSLIHI